MSRLFSRWRRLTIRDRIALFLFIVLAVAGTWGAAFVTRHMAAIEKLERGVGDTVFYSADGRPWFRMDEQRRDVSLDRIAPHLVDAVVAVEDHRFYRHVGIDPIAFARAVWHNTQEGTVVEGGSTITQQLARTLFLSNTRSYNRKIKEALLAVLLELQLTKGQILELYLNRVYLSSGVNGVEPLSQRLFGKGAADLTLAEAALVAGLIRAPSALSPWSNLEGARRRSRVVLSRMQEEGYITAEEMDAAVRQPIRVRPYTGSADAEAGYVKDYLRQQFRNRFGGEHPPDWRVFTSIRRDVQDAADRAVADGLRRLGIKGLQAALVAIDPATGDVLAMVGGSDYRAAPYNRATRGRRQPGSAFKPFVYAAALERGLTPVTVLDELDAIPAAGPEEWRPRNATNDAPERLTLRAALLQSDNRAAVSLQQTIGTNRVLRLADRVGLDDLPDVPSLALGTGLVSPLAMTAAYAIFPNGGLAVTPRSIVRIVDAEGIVAADTPIAREPVIAPETAFQALSMLRDVVDRGTGRQVRALGLRGPVGGKTGTTDDFKDAWFVGFSSSIVATVWVGFDQPATISRNGYANRLALPIWTDFMRRASRHLPMAPFSPPPTLAQVPLCRVSYLRPVADCPTYVEYFKEGDSAPRALCTVHRGSFKQRARQAVEGFFSGIGRRLKGLFGR